MLPGDPLSKPDSMLVGRSKFAKLGRLKKPIEGLIVNRSLNVWAQEIVASKARSQSRLTWSEGARVTGGATPPRLDSCAAVNRLFWINTWPAGVGGPAAVLLYLVRPVL